LAFRGSRAGLFLTSLICLAPLVALGGASTFFLNGSTLLQLCASDSLEQQAACEGYILGVQDSIYSGHLSKYINICFPAGVGTRQLRLQFIQHANNNPAKLHFAAEGLVAESIASIFSCRVAVSEDGEQTAENSLLERPLPANLPKPSPARCPFWPQLKCGWTPD